MAQRLEQQIDSASALINASTKLSGGNYGLGAVITGKIDVRGPAGPDRTDIL